MKPEKLKRSSEHYDRLSEMPDEVVVHILSYLPTIDAVRTMLIHPFGNLWALVPSLNFGVSEILDKIDPDGKWTGNFGRFYIFVRNVLMRHKSPYIDKFYLCLGWLSEDGRNEADDDIRMWLNFALDKQAKEIYFCDVDYVFDFPNLISQSLVTLELCNCTIYSEFQVDPGSLKKLIVHNMTMSEEVFQQFIFGCPSLQELRIEKPYEIRNLSFSVPNIRKLSLVLMLAEPETDPWLLDFPNLKSLDLVTSGIPIVVDVSSVRDFHLVELGYNFARDELRLLKILLNKLRGIEVFQLSFEAAEPFLRSVGQLRLPQMRWKRLVLELRQTCLLGFYQLMSSCSKHLEELIIRTKKLTSGIGLLLEARTACVMRKLKTITLHCYAKPWKLELQLVEFLLKSAITLEKLVIVPNKKPRLTVAEKLEFVMKVSNFQRSSPNARVRFL